MGRAAAWGIWEREGQSEGVVDYRRLGSVPGRRRWVSAWRPSVAALDGVCGRSQSLCVRHGGSEAAVRQVE